MDSSGSDKEQVDLYRELVNAIYEEDFAGILRAKEKGARFDYAFNDSDDPNAPAKTAGSHSVQFRFPYLIRTVLDHDLQEIPLGEIRADGTRINLLDGLVDSVPGQPHEQCLEGLAKCLDMDAPSVVHSMWSAAERALKLDGAEPYPLAERTNCAADILRYGAFPTDPAAFAKVLATPVELGATDAVPVLFLNRIDNTFEDAICRWLDHGLDPNTHIHGMPLLHWFAIESDRERIVARLIEAGADTDARCAYEVFDQVVPAFVRAESMPAGEPCSALDIAREMDRQPTCHVINVSLAKKRIENMLNVIKKLSPSQT